MWLNDDHAGEKTQEQLKGHNTVFQKRLHFHVTQSLPGGLRVSLCPPQASIDERHSGLSCTLVQLWHGSCTAQDSEHGLV